MKVYRSGSAQFTTKVSKMESLALNGGLQTKQPKQFREGHGTCVAPSPAVD